MVELKRRLWYKLHDGVEGAYSMMSLDLILSPNLKTSGMKVSHLLQELGGGYESLLLNLPREMEEGVMEFASEHISCDELVDEACRCRLILEPVGSWEYAIKPILEALPQLSRRFPNLRMYCYGSSEHEFASMGVAVRFARLTLKTALTGDVEVGEWRDALRRSLDVDWDAIEAEAKNRQGGSRVSEQHNSAILNACSTGLSGR